ncbi:MAG: glutathione S-transferase [Betaproteobacteria bacterium]
MKPVLFTFRRCPYAIRARMAVAVSGVAVDMREVDLRNKPQAMLDCSPKGTVPVLQLPDGTVIDESVDIMRWALGLHDPEAWLEADQVRAADTAGLIALNDGTFKYFLDRYKYAGRFPDHSAEYYRGEGDKFLTGLEARLASTTCLAGARHGFADMAIFPFVRQFAQVDKAWFYAAHRGALADWLEALVDSALFRAVMAKPAGE